MFGIVAERVAGVGMALHTLTNAREAIEYLDGKGQYADRSMYQLPEIVVVDLTMPDGNGFDFLEWRMSSQRFAKLPVILLSGSLRSSDVERAEGMGVSAVLEKSGLLAGWEKAIKEIYAIGMKHRQEGSQPVAAQG